MPEPLSPFEFHTGMFFQEFTDTKGRKQFKGACPFCHKIDHFFYGSDNGWGWGCKACQAQGNVYTFIQMLFDKVCTVDEMALNLLAQERYISYETLTRNGFRYNPRNGTYVIPTYNNKDHMNHLYKVDTIKDKNGQVKRQIFNCPGIDPTLMGWHNALHDKILLVEGLWDKPAGEDIVGPARNISVIGFPGSGFRPGWCNAFAGKHLYLITDNDSAGDKHKEFILKKIESAPQKPLSVHIMEWPEGVFKDGYDVNDLSRDKKQYAFDFIMENMQSIDSIKTSTPSVSEIIPDPTCQSFEDLCDACKEIYYFTDDMRSLLHLLITTLYSLKIEGEQLWVRVIGPPGSSKTTVAKIAGASDLAVMRSTFTGILSGWKDDDPSDASLIPMITGKALIVKDGDALLQLPNVKQILSQLRDFYDKFISATYLNRVSYEYENIRSAFVFCGTHALRNMDNAALGERFLDYELRVTNEDRNQITKAAIRTQEEEAEFGVSKEPTIAAKAKNFIDNILLNQDGVAKLHNDDREAIDVFGNIIAYMRAKVERNRNGELLYPPSPEVPSRISKQLVKLYQCAPLILGKREPDTSTYDLARHITGDIIDTKSYRFRVAQYISAAPRQSIHDIVKNTNIEPRIVERVLSDMYDLEMLTISTVNIGSNTSIRAVSFKDQIQSMLLTLGIK